MVVELYMATDLKGLKQFYEEQDWKTIRSMPIRNLVSSLQKVLKSADTKNLEGDQERAYVLYMRYVYLLSEIRNFPDFAREKQYVQSLLGTNSAQGRILEKIGVLQESLGRRYEQLRQQTNQNTNNSNSTNATPQSQSQPPSEHALKGDKKSITCEELFSNIKSPACRYLIMDTRPREEYNTSQIYSQRCVNVPEELLFAGNSAGKIESSLPFDSKELWASRKDQEKIILMDWNTSKFLSRNSPIWHLHEILENWDPDVDVKPYMYFLEGGYELFKTLYPTKCLNPQYERKREETNGINMDEIEYPVIADISMKDSFVGLQGTYGMPGKPKIDRTSKVNAINAYKEKNVEEILKEQEIMADKTIKVHKELIEAESNLKKITEQKENVLDTDMYQNLLTNEQELRYKVLQLENQETDIKNENEVLKEELTQLKQKFDNDLRSREQLWEKMAQEKIEEEVKKRIQQKDLEIKHLQEQRAKEKLERDRNEKAKRAEQKIVPREVPRPVVNRTPKKSSISDEIILDPTALAKIQQPHFDRSVKPSINRPNQSFYNEQDFAAVYGRVERGLTGLKNLGNTCYMNSVIQCLSNTIQLNQYLLEDTFEKHINKSNKTQGHIVRTVAAVMKMLWKGDCKYISSKHLKAVIGEQENLFYGVDQQDAHEFLIMLIDWLHSDLQISSLNEKLQDNLPQSEKAWLEYTKSKKSFILHLFYGQIKSTVKCTVCHKESYTYETFSNLSLELPPVNNRCTLDDCIQLYFAGERVPNYQCLNCKEKRDAIKKLDISKLPPVLIIHLKRFYADPNSNNSYRKRQNYVDFPLTDLDMLNNVARTERSNGSNKNHVYQLYAVSNHYGSMESGHYTAFCKNKQQEKWYKFDDHVVSNLDRSDVKSSAAYILFYAAVHS